MAAPGKGEHQDAVGAEHRPSYEDLVAENQALKTRLAELEQVVEKLRRAGKRQSAPFSKGAPEPEPQRPGRKKGKAHGRHGHRAAPATIDRELEAPLPERCPDCGESVDFERWDEQFQTELPEVVASVTRFRVGVGRCRACKRRVQGRHREQTSDGAAPTEGGLVEGLRMPLAQWRPRNGAAPTEGGLGGQGGGGGGQAGHPQWSRPYRRRIRGLRGGRCVRRGAPAMEPPLQKAD